MRVKIGDEFFLTDGNLKETSAKLSTHGHYSIDAIDDCYFPDRELKFKVTLFPGVTKGERFEWLVEKAVELGVTKFVPLFAKRCIVSSISQNKLNRWGKIAISAMLQCGGCQTPTIEGPISLDQVPIVSTGIRGFVLHPISFLDGRLGKKSYSIERFSPKTLPEFFEQIPSEIWIASGPEGGFIEDELVMFHEKGWEVSHLGNRIFRAETSPIVAISKLMG
ncbi:16S rRNA (uracil(1498)-N(3))-methyltransferase [bacterium]|nr:16S rRNA (uracil(1498)-N(3))-methyltransferase [bacterium]